VKQPDMGRMLKQVQKMQEEMAGVQAALSEETVEASAGGGVVTAIVRGDQTLESVRIDPSAVDPSDVEMLQDLVTAAVNEGLRKSRELAEARLGAVTANIVPPGFNMPGLR